VAALAELVAHGGVAGAIVELSIALAVLLVLGSIWIRERKARGERDERSESLSDDEPTAS